MDNNDGQVPDFEKVPGSNAEAAGERIIPEGQDFTKSFETGVPEFGGFGGEVSERNFGMANPENMYYGEAQSSGVETENDDSENKRDEGIAEAGGILNLIGNIKMTEDRLRKIYEFDADGAEHPAWELAQTLGVAVGDKPKDSAGGVEMERGVNAPVETESSREAEIHAIKAMQELIGEVLEADVDYSELRAGGHGVVEQAAIENEERGVEADRAANLAEVLQGWSEYKKQRVEKTPEDKSEPESEIELNPESEEIKWDDSAEAVSEEEKTLDERIKQQETLNPDILQKQM